MVGLIQVTAYISDTGQIYAVPIPTWQVALAGGTAADETALPTPKGFRPRYRMLQNTANGREKKVKCHAVGSPFWTETPRTPHTAVDDGTKAGIANAITMGNIGERKLIR